ncbi:hypothetical protein [Tenacibaculum maritimum]|uniref:hypothetical protein n=1 Tax=Tenacibaculum maritimum TaxID=107401 RepID=UPI001330F8F6|nr:hypothetical protein [Tenacibaculum maritimum]
MKYITSIILFFFLSCKTTTKEKTIQQEKDRIQLIKTDVKKRKKNNKDLDFDLKEILNQDMIGLSVNEEEEDPLKKYMYDFSGACYSCDIANIKFINNSLILRNICETAKKRVFKINKIDKINKGYEIYFVQNNKEIILFLTKIEATPIYNIVLNKNFEEIEDFRINNFYITKKEMFKLENHSCEDFEG